MGFSQEGQQHVLASFRRDIDSGPLSMRSGGFPALCLQLCFPGTFFHCAGSPVHIWGTMLLIITRTSLVSPTLVSSVLRLPTELQKLARAGSWP